MAMRQPELLRVGGRRWRMQIDFPSRDEAETFALCLVGRLKYEEAHPPTPEEQREMMAMAQIKFSG